MTITLSSPKPAPLPSETAAQYHAQRTSRRPAERVVRALDRVHPGRYLLDPDVLWEIARAAVQATPAKRFGSPEAARQARFQHVIDALADRYGDAIERQPTWILNRCGGAEFAAGTLYASPYEFLFLCGTNMHVHGSDSGTYACDVFDFILEGNNRNTGPSPYEPVEETRAGEYTYLGAGQQKIWSMEGPCWMIDYARGFMPFMMPHGLAENLTVLANPLNTMHNGNQVVRQMVRNTLRRRPATGA